MQYLKRNKYYPVISAFETLCIYFIALTMWGREKLHCECASMYPCMNNGKQAVGTLFYHSDLMKHSWSLNLELSWWLTTSRILLTSHTQRSQADIIGLFTWVLGI